MNNNLTQNDEDWLKQNRKLIPSMGRGKRHLEYMSEDQLIDKSNRTGSHIYVKGLVWDMCLITRPISRLEGAPEFPRWQWFKSQPKQNLLNT